MEVIVRFKKQIWVLLFAGIIMLVVAYLLDPDRSEQIFYILAIFGIVFIMTPFLLIIFEYFWKERRKR